MLKRVVAAASLSTLLALGACGKNSAEKTGENLDSAVENATQGETNLGDGPLEKAGESVDKSTGKENTDPADAINDATDGSKATKP